MRGLKKSIITNPHEMEVGKKYISLDSGEEFLYKNRGKTKEDVWFFNLLMEGNKIALPFTIEGIIYLELIPSDDERRK